MAIFQKTNRNVTQNVASGTGTSNIVGNLSVTSNVSINQNIEVTGNGRIGGNLVVDGNITYINIENLQVEDPIISLGRGANGAPLTINDGRDRGTEMWYYNTAEHTAFVGWMNTTGNMISATNVSISNDVVTVNQFGTFQTGTVYATDILTSNISITGNVTAGNVLSNGIVSAAGNITGSNFLTSGLISATGNVTAGNVMGGANVYATTHTGTTVSVSSNVTAGNLNTAGNITGGNILTSGLVSATGNINADSITASSNVFATSVFANAGQVTSGYFYTPGNIDGSNVNTGRVITGNGTASSPAFSFANDGGIDTGFYLASDGVIGITNNATQSGYFGSGTLSLTGTITGGNLATGGTVSATGNTTVGNLLTGGLISATGNITGGNVGGIIRPTAGSGTAGIIFPLDPGGGSGDVASIKYYASTGEATVLELAVTNDAEDIIKLNATGGTTVTGTLTGDNLATSGTVSATGNITTAAYFHGDGSFVSNAAFAGNTIRNGTSNVKVGTVDGNVSITVGPTSNIVVVTPSELSVAGNVVSNYLLGTLIGNVSTGGDISAGGNITGNNLVASNTVVATNANITANVLGGNLLGTTVSVSGNATAGNIFTGGLISAAGGITANTTLSVTGNITAGNVNLTGLGALRGTGAYVGYLIANAATGIALDVTASANVGANLSVGGTISAAGNITSNSNLFTSGTVSAAGNIVGNNISGTLITASQPSITSLGTLTSLDVSGNVTAAYFIGNVVGNISGNITPAGSNTYVQFNDSSALGASAGFTFNKASNAVTVSGNITGSYIIGNGSQLTGLPAGYANSDVATYLASGTNSSNIITTANISGSYILGNGSQLTGLPAGYANSDVATYLASGTNSSNIITTANISGGNISTGGIISAVGNIITDGVFVGTATSARYADVAENYLSDAEYAPGTVLDFGGAQEVTISSADSSRRVAGVVSTNPAYLMNSMAAGANVIALALVGRVPVSVVGAVRKGDCMVSAGDGYARAEPNPESGTIIGKSIENFGGGRGVIEILVCLQ